MRVLCPVAPRHRPKNALREEGFAIERRDFKPHITIAREVVANGPIWLEPAETAMTVERISLMRSRRGDAGMVYTEIFGRELPFSGLRAPL